MNFYDFVQVNIQAVDSTTTTAGILGIYHTAECVQLLLMTADKSQVYAYCNNRHDLSKRIPSRFVVDQQDDNVLESLAECFKSPHVKYRFIEIENYENNNNNNNILAIVISDHNPETAIVSKLWQLRKDRQDDASSAYHLYEILIQSCKNKQVVDFDVQQQNGLRKEMLEWKDTAEKLAGEWEREKAQLLQQFFHMYNLKCDETNELRVQRNELLKTIEDLEEQLANNARTTTTATSRAGKQKVENPEFVKSLPTDQDELFDTDLVATLAAGPKRKQKTKEPAKAIQQKTVVDGWTSSDSDSSIGSFSHVAPSVIKSTKGSSVANVGGDKMPRKRKTLPDNSDKTTLLSKTFTTLAQEEDEIKTSILDQLAALKRSEEVKRQR